MRPRAALLGLAVLVAAPFLFDMVPAQSSEQGGVIGADDRRAVDSQEAPWASIGRLNFGGRGYCTATLIAGGKVVTAAHCLFDPRTSRRWPPQELHFLAGWNRERYLSHSRGQASFMAPDFTFSKSPDLDLIKRDFAVIELQGASLVASLRPLSMTREEASRETFFHASYSRDRPYILSVQDSCRVVEARRDYWLTDCDTNHGGSGAPLLVRHDDEVRVAGIMVGYREAAGGKLSVVVPISSPMALEVLSEASVPLR